MSRVAINKDLIRWAVERSGQEESALVERFPKLPQWESGTVQPTFKQLEDFAKATLTPFGAFFLPAPPQEKLPVPDFRTMRDQRPRRPSAALLETIYQMQRRQEWMREYLLEEGVDALSFIGTVTLASSPVAASESIRRMLGMEDGWAELHPTWSHALLGLRRAVEDTGVLVVVNGVFGNNTHQALDPEEFRGFVLCDRHAPLIFINGADFKSAQMFTLAHELAHLWLGKDGVFNLPDLQPSDDAVEKFCNRVAAEVLIPSRELEACWPQIKTEDNPYNALARRFKVSPMVAARRVLDHGLISREKFFTFLKADREAEKRKQQRRPSGGDFYRTQEVRIGHRFGAAVIRAARAGKLLYRDAYRLTGLYGKTFDQFAQELGFGPA
ncbi:MAG: ImmA/IrrE family metallo-endopeptidase [Verrucomicrobiales bacterium]|nr:ImmA/IrrE family metallo-endopeptidase [Verrucomicrobiales bacterium]